MARATAATPTLGFGRRFTPRRSQLLLVLLIVLGFWLVLVFGRTLTELNETTDRVAAVAAETEELNARLDAGRRELVLVQADSFQRLQARSFGMGEPGEVVFSLESGTVGPAPIVPIAGAGTDPESGSPLDAWLDLLFGN
jgi:hypothetical protein